MSDQKLFEFGKVYRITDKNASDVIKKYEESGHLSLFVTGQKAKESWYNQNQEVDFNYLKAYAFNLLKRIGIDAGSMDHTKVEKDYLSVGLNYVTPKGTLLEIGVVSDSVLKEFDIRQQVFYAEINWDIVLKLIKGNRIQYEPIPKFPEVRRDLALLIDSKITFEEIEKLAYKTESKLLKNVNLFDVYEGKNIEAGKKSYAVSFILLDEEKTLTDKVIEKTMSRLMEAYQKELGAVIR
jgi:phenylalanyl-tRNA synthetase beta chain